VSSGTELRASRTARSPFGSQRRASARVYCDCCRGWSAQAGFTIALADGDGTRQVCTRCASHVSLKADGAMWMPGVCPDAPHPRLRIFHDVAAEQH
jgi:hypothetical protein